MIDSDVARMIDYLTQCDIEQLEESNELSVNGVDMPQWYYDEHIVYYSFYTQDGDIVLNSAYYNPLVKRGYNGQRFLIPKQTRCLFVLCWCEGFSNYVF